MTDFTVENRSAAWIDRITLGELEKVWTTSFDRLVTTSIIAAEGKVRPEVFNLLRSPKWRDRWNDALHCALAELETSCERMLYEGDIRFEKTHERVILLRRSSKESSEFLKARDLEIDRQSGAPEALSPTAESATRKILMIHFNSWLQEELKNVMAQQGLPAQRPLKNLRFSDGIELLEFLISEGALRFPGEEEALRLQRMTDAEFRNQVAQDVSDQENRIHALRHPLMLNDWMAALQDLQEMTWSALGMETNPGDQLPKWSTPSGPDERAVYLTLRRRRFYRAILQRKEEWLRLRRAFVRTAVVQQVRIEQPWIDALEQVCASIPNAFPREHAAVRRALDSFGAPPGSSVLSKAYRKNRKKVDGLILEALQDGSWINFLKG